MGDGWALHKRHLHVVQLVHIPPRRSELPLADIYIYVDDDDDDDDDDHDDDDDVDVDVDGENDENVTLP
jgi:hypothetical protein